MSILGSLAGINLLTGLLSGSKKDGKSWLKTPASSAGTGAWAGDELKSQYANLARLSNRYSPTGVGLNAGNQYNQMVREQMGKLRNSGLRGSTYSSGVLAKGAGALTGALTSAGLEEANNRYQRMMQLVNLLNTIYGGQTSLAMDMAQLNNQNKALKQQQLTGTIDAIAKLSQLLGGIKW